MTRTTTFGRPGLPCWTHIAIAAMIGVISTSTTITVVDAQTKAPDDSSSSPVDLTAITEALKNAVNDLKGGGGSSDDEDEMVAYTLNNNTEGPATKNPLNVYGDPLLPCSTKGMALTGYTNRGYCEDHPPLEIDDGVVYVESDYLTHNVCVDIPSNKHGIFNCNATTGQPNWCDDSPEAAAEAAQLLKAPADPDGKKKKSYACPKGQKDHHCASKQYPCAEDQEDHSCSIENWCICEWAFAMYMDIAGGCSKIPNIVCDATNMKVVLHYQESFHNHNDTNAKRALDCLKEKCGTSILT